MSHPRWASSAAKRESNGTMTFQQFFTAATGGNPPYDYQRRLAEEPACDSRLIEIPTGLGKTAAVVLAWLWNRVICKDPKHKDKWPRRLVYCLPMRTLVEQTQKEVRKWLRNVWKKRVELALSDESIAALRWLRLQGPVLLMGGERRHPRRPEWDIHPEREAILIGTQDMLLSRALNRGYGMSRYRWPMHFGLLNNDALWVMDETQLMGPALWTSAQLDWMRLDRFPSLFPCPTWWMSATVGVSPTGGAAFLKTSDRERAKFPIPSSLVLGDEPNASVQLGACRPCELWTAPASPKKSAASTKKAAAEASSPEVEFASALGNAVVAEHRAGTLSLVVCNTVRTAQAVFAAASAASGGKIPCVLLTSRFRKMDRKDCVAALTEFEGKRKAKDAGVGSGLICVSTQVVEAGVDVSSVRLWSEVAPWPSLVQRLGRLNRDGRDNAEARALFFKPPLKDQKTKKGAKIGPYLAEAVAQGERILAALVKLTVIEPKVPSREALARLREDKTIGKEIAAALQPVPEPYPRAMDIQRALFDRAGDLWRLHGCQSIRARL
ncbi:MAG TPA: DEAD/DEAH box helicase [Chthoniobacteraceae bacterium]